MLSGGRDSRQLSLSLEPITETLAKRDHLWAHVLYAEEGRQHFPEYAAWAAVKKNGFKSFKS